MQVTLDLTPSDLNLPHPWETNQAKSEFIPTSGFLWVTPCDLDSWTALYGSPSSKSPPHNPVTTGEHSLLCSPATYSGLARTSSLNSSCPMTSHGPGRSTPSGPGTCLCRSSLQYGCHRPHCTTSSHMQTSLPIHAFQLHHCPRSWSLARQWATLWPLWHQASSLRSLRWWNKTQGTWMLTHPSPQDQHQVTCA